jgi:hydrogenase 3 maturation protease
VLGTLIMCIGNRDGGDDGIGPYIADMMKKGSHNDAILDCGTIPENYTAVIKRMKPKTLLLIDAAEMNLPAGEIRIIPKEKLGTMHISTHGIPLSSLITYLEKDVENIIVLGIQPKRMSGAMSSTVKKSGNHLIELLKTNRVKQIPIL